MSRFAVCLLGLAIAAPAIAQTSSFDATAQGIHEPLPALVVEDLRAPDGRAEISIVPDAIATGSQRFLHATNWGFWLWTNELHAHFFATDGTRHLVRLKDAEGLPWPGVTGIAGQPLTFTVSWSPAGIGIFGGDGTLRAYLEGSFAPPAADLGYGATPTGNNPYSGGISIDVYADPLAFDPCQDYPAWGTLATYDASGGRSAQQLIPQPTCQAVADPDESTPIVEGLAQLTLSWTPPTENEDGSPLGSGDIDGYVLYWHDASRAGRCTLDTPAPKLDTRCYSNAIDIAAAGSTSSHLEQLTLSEDTTLYFAMSAYRTVTDDQGVQKDLISRYSNEIARNFILEVEEVAEPAPGAPTLDQVEVQITCSVEDPNLICRFRSPQ